MRRIHGIGVSSGTAYGMIYFLPGPSDTVAQVPRNDQTVPAKERVRFHDAVRQTVGEFKAMERRYRNCGMKNAADLLSVYALLAEDEDFTALVLCLIGQGKSAEYAVRSAGEFFAGQFSESDVLRDRASDILDVTNHLRQGLSKQRIQEIPSGAVILAGENVFPSMLMEMDSSVIVGVLMQKGSGSGHTAILARSMGVPTICGLGDSLPQRLEGTFAWMDGETGDVILEPERDGTQQPLTDAPRRDYAPLELSQFRLYSTMNMMEELTHIAQSNAEGIGLLRSELLWMGNSQPPSEHEQFCVYQSIAKAMEGRLVIIRTFDFREDKQPLFAQPMSDQEKGSLLRPQLRAIIRASAFGNLAVLFPMVSTQEEMQNYRTLYQYIAEELREQDTPFDEAIRLGAMIETPAAVNDASSIAETADFFSVGTNDLSCFLCNVNRQSVQQPLIGSIAPLVQALRRVASAAQARGLPVYICGELVAQPALQTELIHLGLNRISLSARFFSEQK